MMTTRGLKSTSGKQPGLRWIWGEGGRAAWAMPHWSQDKTGAGHNGNKKGRESEQTRRDKGQRPSGREVG